MRKLRLREPSHTAGSGRSGIYTQVFLAGAPCTVTQTVFLPAGKLFPSAAGRPLLQLLLLWLWLGPRRPCCPGSLAGGGRVPHLYWSCLTVPGVGPPCPAADVRLCLDFPVGGLWGPGAARRRLFAAVCTFPGPLPPPRGRPTPKGTLAGRALAHTCGQIWLLPGHGVRKRQGQPFLNVLSWLSALRGVASGGWEKASGFGPWERRPVGGGFSQASLAVSPTAVHARDGWSQGRGPAGPSRGPCRGLRPRLWPGNGAR